MYAKWPMFMPNFNQFWISSTNFHKISNPMAVCPVGAQLIQEDGRTDIMKLVSALREYGDATKTATDVDKSSASRSRAARAEMQNTGLKSNKTGSKKGDERIP